MVASTALVRHAHLPATSLIMNTLRILRKVLIIILGFVLLGMILFYGLLYYVWMPAVPEERAARIEMGMREGDVEAILGKPGIIKKEQGEDIWCYNRPMQWASFSVRFSTNGKVVAIEDDR